MSLRNQFKTDEKLEVEGFWFEAAISEENDKPIRFKLARAGGGNKKYGKVLERVSRPYRQILDSKSEKNAELREAKAEEVMLAVFSEAVLVDWDNVPKADVTGNPKDKGTIEYSVENAKKLLKELPELYHMLNREASILDNYREQEREEIAGN